MFPHYITAGPLQREELLREILIIIFRRGVFTNFIKQNYSERRKTERKKFLYVFTITSSGPPQREENFFF